MKLLVKTSSIILCLCLCTYLSSCTSNERSSKPNDDYKSGYDAGYDAGFDDGTRLCENDYDLGYNVGYNNGYDAAGEDDYHDAYMDGYNAGNNDGYYAGATYTCLFFGDIERAFKCAKNGSAWYTLIDAYDQYEYDIYDDDDKETRSELFWALVSYTSEDGATAEEHDLLFSAFGSDLYYLDE